MMDWNPQKQVEPVIQNTWHSPTDIQAVYGSNYVLLWLGRDRFYPCLSGLLYWHRDNHLQSGIDSICRGIHHMNQRRTMRTTAKQKSIIYYVYIVYCIDLGQQQLGDKTLNISWPNDVHLRHRKTSQHWFRGHLFACLAQSLCNLELDLVRTYN